MIEIKFTGMCEDCRCADLEVHCLRRDTGDKWIVTCSHKYACERIMTKPEVFDDRSQEECMDQ